MVYWIEESLFTFIIIILILEIIVLELIFFSIIKSSSTSVEKYCVFPLSTPAKKLQLAILMVTI